MINEERIDEINRGTPSRIDLLTIICFAIMLLVIIFLLGFWTINRVASDQKPEILILSETFVSNWEGRTVLLVDYTVGGIATNATFRESQMDRYNALMDHLEKTGRVRR